MTICSDLLKPGGYGRLKPMLKNLQEEMTAAGATNLAEWSAHKSNGRGTVVPYIESLHNASSNGMYTFAGNEKLPRTVDSELQMWGCVACNFCVTVCPNDAFFRLPTGDLEVEGRQQYFVLSELCNECGNCMVFCPEAGDPAEIKPRLYTTDERFALESKQAFRIHIEDDGYWVEPNAAGAEATSNLLQILNAQEGFPLAP